MGVMAAVAELVKGDVLDGPKRVVSKAEADLTAETKRIAQAEAELEQMTTELRGMDPDGDAKGFAKAVQARDAIRGRLEALAERRRRIETELEAARGNLVEAQTDANRTELDSVNAEIRRRDAALTVFAKDWDRQVREEREVIRRLGEKAAALAGAVGDPSLVVGSRWVAIWIGDPLEVAARMVARNR